MRAFLAAAMLCIASLVLAHEASMGNSRAARSGVTLEQLIAVDANG